MKAFPGADLIVNGIFLLCLATVGVGALIAVLSTRLIRGVCGLAITCLGLAGLYYFLHSPFLALMEILIYIGAVCVTIVFAVMLAEPDEPARTANEKRSWVRGGVALGVAGTIFCGLYLLGSRTAWPVTNPAKDPISHGTIQEIGVALLSTYSLAFELISLALLVAILGALAIARTGRAKA